MRPPDRAPAAKKTSRRAKSRPAAATKKARPARRRPGPGAGAVYVPGPLVDCEAVIDRALADLLARDPVAIARMVERAGRPPLRRREPGFEGLVAIVVSQQVSVASAEAIMRRVTAGLASPLEASAVAAASEEALRACGLSGPKMRTLRALAAAVGDGLALDALAALPPEEAHRRLVAVKGIGPWTADIFLLFCLGHPDAFPAGDLALQEAARLALGLRSRPDAARLERIAERWRPWRGVAARLLWAYYRVAKSREGMALAGPAV